jgi:RNA polymerase sigma-70 factor (ECF subfamily)
VTSDQDAELLERLRSGDEQAFVTLVRRHHGAMMRVASSFVPSQQVAEEVVQETWVAVLRGLEDFEGRSSLRTWLFRILVNRARTAGVRERRSVAVGDRLPSVDGSRFDDSGSWLVPPDPWPDRVDDMIHAQAVAKLLRAAIADLPDRQRRVVTLRDIEGLSGAQVCGILDLTEANQRVLLHRARSRLRQVIETEFGRV